MDESRGGGGGGWTARKSLVAIGFLRSSSMETTCGRSIQPSMKYVGD